MPELPDIALYLEAIERRVIGRVLERVRIANVFVLRTAVPPIDSLAGRRLVGLRRLGKRIAFGFEEDRWSVLHLNYCPRCQTGGKLLADRSLSRLHRRHRCGSRG